ncbi:MAG TPA: hypothetical protein ENH82_01780 [bacterium]|nr:hypothetical protein [bacterium]
MTPEERLLESIFGELEPDKYNCAWLNCEYGMGLAGMDRCSASGADPMSLSCPKFSREKLIES